MTRPYDLCCTKCDESVISKGRQKVFRGRDPDDGPMAYLAAVSPHRRVSGFVVALSVLLALTCMSGVFFAFRMADGADPLPVTRSLAAPGIADDVSTSFGFIAVQHALAISGLSDKDITGAHGVPGLVQAGTIDIEMGVTITNMSSELLPYSPSQFQLLVGKGNLIEQTRAPKVPGELQPNAAIDMLLDFVTTTEARPFTVRFIDPATQKPLLISLGDVGCQVQSGNGVPLPVEGGCTVAPAADHGGH